jgi:hypothetical protein
MKITAMRMDNLEMLFNHVLADVADHIVISPLMPAPTGEHGFGMIIGGGGKSFHCDVVSLVDKHNKTAFEDCETMRCHVIAELAMEAQKRYSPVPRIHVFDDELKMAAWCAETWDELYTSVILKRIEQKYAERLKGAH